MSVSTAPMDMKPSWTSTTGTASETVARNSDGPAPSLLFEIMRFGHLVTVVGLVVARDALPAQSVVAGAQAIPLVTRADPTAARDEITEGYLTQPAAMAHASWKA